MHSVLSGKDGQRTWSSNCVPLCWTPESVCDRLQRGQLTECAAEYCTMGNRGCGCEGWARRHHCMAL